MKTRTIGWRSLPLCVAIIHFASEGPVHAAGDAKLVAPRTNGVIAWVDGLDTPSSLLLAQNAGSTVVPVLDREVMKAGLASARIEHGFSEARREHFDLRIGKDLPAGTSAFTMWVRGDGSGLEVRPYAVWWMDERHRFQAPIQPVRIDFRGWKELHIAVPPPGQQAPPKRLSLDYIRFTQTANSDLHTKPQKIKIHLDDLRHERPATPGERPPLTLSLVTDQPGDVLTPDADGKLAAFVRVANSRDAAEPVTYSFEVIDRRERVCARGSGSIEAAAECLSFKKIEFPNPALAGPFVIRARRVDSPDRVEDLNEALLDNFDAGAPPVVSERQTKEKPSVQLVAEPAKAGKAVAVRYQWGSGHWDHFVMGYARSLPGRVKSLKMWLYIEPNQKGDSRLRLGFADRAERQFSREVRLNWEGWRDVTLPIATWPFGNTDCESSAPTLCYPIRLTSLTVAETGPGNWLMASLNHPGSFVMDELRVQYSDAASLVFSVPNARVSEKDFLPEVIDPVTASTEHVTVRRVSESARDGFGALELTYCFPPKGLGQSLPCNLNVPMPGSPIAIGAWILGAGRGEDVVFQLGKGLSTRPIRVAWTGWKYAEVPLPGTGRGAPAGWTARPFVQYPLPAADIHIRAGALQAPDEDSEVTGKLVIGELVVKTQLDPTQALKMSAVSDFSNPKAPAAVVRVDNALLSTDLPVVGTLSVKDWDGRPVGTPLEIQASLRAQESCRRRIALPADLLQSYAGPFEVTLEAKGDPPIVRSAFIHVRQLRVTIEDFEDRGRVSSLPRTAECKSGLVAAVVPCDFTDSEEKQKQRHGRPLTVEMDLRQVMHTRPRSLSLWVKPGHAGVLLQVQVFDRGPNPSRARPTDRFESQWYPLVAGWQRLEMALPTAGGRKTQSPVTYRYDLPFTLDKIVLKRGACPVEKTRVLIDGIVAEAEGLPLESVQASLLFERLSNVMLPGEPVRVWIENQSLFAPFKGRLDIGILDGLGDRLFEKSVPIALAPGKSSFVAPGYSIPAPGYYRVQWSLHGKEGVLAEGGEDVPGLDVAGATGEKATEQLNTLVCDPYALRSRAGIRYERVHLSWADLQLEPHHELKEWKWEFFDDHVKKLHGAGVNVIGRLGFTALWCSRSAVRDQKGFWTGDAYTVPTDLKAWFTYVKHTVQRYKDAIKIWEVWDQPDRSVEQINMDLATYLKLLRIASVTVKKIDPQAKIMLGNLTSPGMAGYLESLLKQGGGQFIDIVSVTPADPLTSPELGYYDRRIERVRNVVDAQAKEKELWIGGYCWSSGDLGDCESSFRQVRRLARGYAIARASGAKVVVDDFGDPSGEYRSVGIAYRKQMEELGKARAWQSRTPNWFLKPVFFAVRGMRSALDDVQFFRRVYLRDAHPDRSRCYVFEKKGGGLVVAAWRLRGCARIILAGSLKPKRAYDVCQRPLEQDERGLEIGPTPVFLEYDPAAREAVLDGLPEAELSYPDDPRSMWKQRLLARLSVGNMASEEAHGFTVDGKSSPVRLRSSLPDGRELVESGKRVAGTATFTIPLGEHKDEDLVLRCRTSVGAVQQEVLILLDGEPCSAMRLGIERTMAALYDADSRLRDVVVLIPRDLLEGKESAKIALSCEQPFDVFSIGAYAKSGPRELFLGDTDPLVARQSRGRFRPDANVFGRPMAFGEEQLAKGIGVHAHSKIVYPLAGRFRKFMATVGLDAASGDAGSVIFSVSADGKELFRSEGVTAYTKPIEVVVDVTGRKLLELTVFGTKDGIENDFANWADARLTY